MTVCAYCKQQKKPSNEHLISHVALKEFYGYPVDNTVHTKRSGKWKKLPNNEQTINDVCRECNSKLSEFDQAGAQLLRDINRCIPFDTLTLVFKKETLNWLIKTHLNNFRQNSTVKGKEIRVDHRLYKHLIKNEVMDSSLYHMLTETIVIKGDIWERGDQRLSSIFNTVGLLNDRLAYSEIRFKYLSSFMVLPLDGVYDTFLADLDNGKLALNVLMHPYAKSLDTSALISGSLSLTKDFPFERYILGLVKINDYEKLFS